MRTLKLSQAKLRALAQAVPGLGVGERAHTTECCPQHKHGRLREFNVLGHVVNYVRRLPLLLRSRVNSQ